MRARKGARVRERVCARERDEQFNDPLETIVEKK